MSTSVFGCQDYFSCAVVLILVLSNACLINCASGQGSEADVRFRELLLEQKDESGVTPSLESALEILGKRKGELSGLNMRDAWRIIGDVQKAPVSKVDLAAILTAQRESFASIQIEYASLISGGQSPRESSKGLDQELPQEAIRSNCKFIQTRQGSRYFVQVVDEAASRDQDKSISIETFDNEVVRTYRHVKPLDQRKHVDAGGVLSLDSFARFYRRDNPLVTALLIDSKEISIRDRLPVFCDLVEFVEKSSTVIFEAPTAMHGYECILLSDGAKNVYIAPSLGYIAVDVSIVSRQEAGDKIVSQVVLQRTFSDFKDTGIGFHFPWRLTEKGFTISSATSAGGKPSRSQDVTISKLVFNNDYPDSTFSDIWPTGTSISDVVSGVAYTFGDNDKPLDLQRVGGLAGMRITFIVLNVVAIVIIAAFVWRRRFSKQ